MNNAPIYCFPAEWIRRLCSDRRLSREDVSLAVKIGARVDLDDDTARLSDSDLCRITEKPHSAVLRSRALLIEHGYIASRPGIGTAVTEYRLRLPDSRNKQDIRVSTVALYAAQHLGGAQ